MVGRVAGDVDDLEADAGDRELVVAADTVCCRIVRCRPGSPPRVSPVRRASTSPAGAQTSAPVPSASSATPAMWSMSVCVTRIAAGSRSHARELEADRRRIVAGIDHDRLGGSPLASHDVAVAAIRAHHEGVDDD